MWPGILNFAVGLAVAPFLATVGALISSDRMRAVVKSIFRRPSKSTLLVKTGNTWVDVSDGRVVSDEERDLLTKMVANTPVSDSHASRNGGAGTDG